MSGSAMTAVLTLEHVDELRHAQDAEAGGTEGRGHGVAGDSRRLGLLPASQGPTPRASNASPAADVDGGRRPVAHGAAGASRR